MSNKASRRRPLTFADVREIALSMHDVEETTAYGMPAFKAAAEGQLQVRSWRRSGKSRKRLPVT